jgi:abortive infection bacteriophage resistance protein
MAKTIRTLIERPHSPSAQIELLEAAGMTFQDKLWAEQQLRFVNYFRLRFYWVLFQENSASGPEPTHFRAGTIFEEVYALYEFDRKLRHLFLDAVERIEIAVRTRWGSELARVGGSFAHTRPELFLSPKVHHHLLRSLEEAYQKSDEVFAEDFRRDPSLEVPPIWASSELLTLTKLSQWFDNTKSSALKDAVAADFGLTGSFLASYLHQLSLCRNTAAHHSRLWNRKFAVALSKPPKSGLKCGISRQILDHVDRRKVFPVILVTHAILCKIDPDYDWSERLLRLLDQELHLPVWHMGFPLGWREALQSGST